MKLAKNDVRTTTGRNLRKLMILLGKNSVDELNGQEIDKIEYHRILESETLRLSIIEELMQVKNEEFEVPGMVSEELNEILNHICTT